MWSFIAQNKQKAAVAGASVAGIAMSWYTIWQAERHVRERESADHRKMVLRTRKETLAEEVRNAAYFCLATDIESIRQVVSETINTEECIAELKNMNSQAQVAIARKVSIWEQLKVRTLIRCVVALYSLVLCNALLLVYSTVELATDCGSLEQLVGNADAGKRIQRLMSSIAKLVAWNESTFKRAFLAFLRRFADAALQRGAVHADAVNLKDSLTFSELTHLLDRIHAATLLEVTDKGLPNEVVKNDAVALYRTCFDELLSSTTVVNGSDADMSTETESGPQASSAELLLERRFHDELHELFESAEFTQLLEFSWNIALRRFSDWLTEPFLAAARQTTKTDADAAADLSVDAQVSAGDNGVCRVPIAKLIPLLANATNELFSNECKCAREAKESRTAPHLGCGSLIVELQHAPVAEHFSKNLFDAFRADPLK